MTYMQIKVLEQVKKLRALFDLTKTQTILV